MSGLGLVFGSAALTFTVTNIDAFCLLVLFFAKAKINEGSTNLNVCIGQFIGFTIIVSVSLLGLALSASIESRYVSLLGIVPIMMSVRSMYYDWDWVYIKECLCCQAHANSSPKQIKNSSAECCGDIELGPTGIDADSPHIALGTDPDCADCTVECDLAAIDLTASTKGNELDDMLDALSVHSDEPEAGVLSFLKRFFPAQVVEVAVVAVSNGGDNIATYLPFFAQCSTQEILITIGVYYVLLMVWLVTAHRLLGDRRVIGLLHRYGHYLVPLCLIATGVYILSDSILFQLH